MSEENKNSTQQTNTNLQFVINAQYLKDLSFENPKAPDSLKNFNAKPDIKLDVDIKSRPLKDHGEDMYEVDLIIKGTTKISNETMFLIESTYSGIFTIKNGKLPTGCRFVREARRMKASDYNPTMLKACN